MKIVLLRHGESLVPKSEPIKAIQLDAWIILFNLSGIKSDAVPPAIANQIASSCQVIVCSDYPRSIDSVDALGVKSEQTCDAMFREMGLSSFSLPFLKLKPKIWILMFRTFWLFGLGSTGESKKEGVARANLSASKLETLAEENGSVLLVGHYFVNRFIGKRLLANHWVGPKNLARIHWGFTVYEKVL